MAKSFAVLAVMALAKLPPARRPQPGPFQFIPAGPESIIRSFLTGAELASAQAVSPSWNKRYDLWSPMGRKMYEAKATKRIEDDRKLYAHAAPMAVHTNVYCCRYFTCIVNSLHAWILVPTPCDRCRFHFAYYMEPVEESQDPWLSTLDNDSFYAGPQICDACDAESKWIAAEKEKAEARIRELRARARELARLESCISESE